ncbi:MAG: hypothetical protein ACI857_002800, partial [Arenicella sp.]
NRDQCFSFLEGLGYAAFINSEKGLIPFDPQSHKKQNFVFKIG